MMVPRPMAAAQLDRLKETARRHELREEWQEAIGSYQMALERLAEQGEPADAALHNRIGDLQLKAGDTDAATLSYGHAVEAYAEQGYHNNAIALCGKILRVDPAQAEVLLRLAGLQVRQRVLGEVRRNLVSYIEAMGSPSRQSALRSGLQAFLEEHADDLEVRASLLEVLREVPRTDQTEGTLDRLIRELTDPPPAEGADGPEAPRGPVARASLDGLIFIDTSVDSEVILPAGPGRTPPEAVLEPRVLPEDAPTEPEAVVAPLPALTPTILEVVEVTETAEPLVMADSDEPVIEGLAPGPVDPPPGFAATLRAQMPGDGGGIGKEHRGPPSAPATVAECQVAVEAAYRARDRVRLVAAYFTLADALERTGAADRAALVYQRILEHDPGNQLAEAALRVPSPSAQPAAPADGFVDLAALILEPAPTPNPRMRVDQPEPEDAGDVDFREALEQFKQGIAVHVEATDFQSHYDLGVAFKEMGLLDEAIAQFQKALRAPGGRLRGAEALGIAFFEQGRLAVAESVLSRALEAAPGGDDEKIGLIYWLGRALEAQGKTLPATRAYERALAEDITFLDLRDRLARLSSEQPL